MFFADYNIIQNSVGTIKININQPILQIVLKIIILSEMGIHLKIK